ncbi:hypothetical protein AKJ16_DCAP27270 [Drosera capensis]
MTTTTGATSQNSSPPPLKTTQNPPRNDKPSKNSKTQKGEETIGGRRANPSELRVRDPAIQHREDLQEILTNLRDEHLYCLFCGCQYESSEALLSNCPGINEDDH